MSLSAGEIVRLLKSDRDALRELAVAVASEPELRLAVINAVLADVATKQDIQQMRQELKGEISQLRQHVDDEIAQLRQELAQLRQHVDSEISQLRQEIAQMRQHVDSEISQLRRDMNTNFRWTVGLILGIWGTTVIPLLMKMAGII
jgi:predicted ribosome quality control (RQC) complex YloA/Tae2 family protein